MRFDQPTMVDTSHGPLAVHEHGEGPPVVLLHGVFGASPVWAPVATRLAEHHRVLAVDLLGFGDSARPSDPEVLSAPQQADAVAQALETLGIAPAAFVGYDYGGPVALTLSRAHPERVSAMVLTATNAFPDAPIPFPLSAMFLPVAGGLVERALFSRAGLRIAARAGAGSGFRPDPALILGDRAQSHAVAGLFSRALRQLSVRYTSVEEALRALRVPTLVIWGDKDLFFSLEHGRRTAAAVPGSQLRVYPGAGHFVPEEQPDRFAADVLEHLQAVAV